MSCSLVMALPLYLATSFREGCVSIVMALPLHLATSFRGGGVGAVLPSTYGRASQWGV